MTEKEAYKADLSFIQKLPSIRSQTWRKAECSGHRGLTRQTVLGRSQQILRAGKQILCFKFLTLKLIYMYRSFKNICWFDV